MQRNLNPATRLRATRKRVARRVPDASRTARNPLPLVAALLGAAVLAQLLLGSALGVGGIWLAPLLVAMLLAILVVVDTRRGDSDDAEAERYDGTAITLAALAIAAAVACLYMPMPWGGMGAAAIVLTLVGALRLIDDA